MNGQTVCRTHGGASKQAKAKAARLLEQSALPAVITMRNIMLDENTDDALKVKTALGLLDRIPGFGKNSRVETDTPPWAVVLQQVTSNVTQINPGVPGWVLKQAEGIEPPQSALEEAVEAEVIDDFEPSDYSNVLSFDTPVVRGSANPPRRK